MKKALIFCHHPVPTSHPNAVRLLNFSLMLKELGYETILYGVGIGEELSGQEKGISFVQWSSTAGQGFFPHVKRKKEFLSYIKTTLQQTKDVSLIISAIGITAPKAHKYLRNFAKKNRITFLQSIVEWYGLAHLGGWKYFPRFLRNEYLMRIDNVKSKKIISISSYLSNYYSAKGCSTITIPTIVDTAEYEDTQHTENDRLVVCYAGAPRRKDCIMNAIFALEKLSPNEREKIQFHIFGATESDLSALGLTHDMKKHLEDVLVLHGKIPYDQVKAYVAQADYTILLRHNTRNANAGFSTKVGESMACGTPVIANITSDLAKHIIPGETGIVCKDESVDSCVEAYRHILQIPPEEYHSMRTKAKAIAQTDFNIESYTEPLRKFIEEA